MRDEVVVNGVVCCRCRYVVRRGEGNGAHASGFLPMLVFLRVWDLCVLCGSLHVA